MATVDTSIYGQYLKPVKTIAEYGDEGMARAIQQNALQQSRLKADEYSRGVAEKNALRSAVQQFGPDRKANTQLLLQRGLLKEAQAYEKEYADVEYKGAQTRQAGAAADSSIQTALKAKREQHAQMLSSVTTPELFAQWAEMGAANGVFNAQEAALLKPTVQATLQDPSKFPELLQRMKMLTVSQEKQYGEGQSTARNAATIAGSAANNEANNVRSMLNTEATVAGGAANNENTRRSVEKIAGAVDARVRSEGAANRVQADRHFNERQAAKEAGSGNAAALLSPKDIQKREASYPKNTLQLKAFEQTTDILAKDLATLRDHPGLGSITGIAAGRLPGITENGRAAQALLDKVLARGGFQELADMRASSPTGGALGSISNKENEFLRSAFAAIDRRQDAPAVKAAINDAIEKVKASKANVREAYELTYEYRGGTPSEPSSPKPDGKPSQLTPAEQAELESLRKRLGR